MKTIIVLMLGLKLLFGVGSSLSNLKWDPEKAVKNVVKLYDKIDWEYFSDRFDWGIGNWKICKVRTKFGCMPTYAPVISYMEPFAVMELRKKRNDYDLLAFELSSLPGSGAVARSPESGNMRYSHLYVVPFFSVVGGSVLLGSEPGTPRPAFLTEMWNIKNNGITQNGVIPGLDIDKKLVANSKTFMMANVLGGPVVCGLRTASPNSDLSDSQAFKFMSGCTGSNLNDLSSDTFSNPILSATKNLYKTINKMEKISTTLTSDKQGYIGRCGPRYVSSLVGPSFKSPYAFQVIKPFSLDPKPIGISSMQMLMDLTTARVENLTTKISSMNLSSYGSKDEIDMIVWRFKQYHTSTYYNTFTFTPGWTLSPTTVCN